MIKENYEKLREQLLDRRLKVRPMCRDIGISYQTIYNIIHGKGMPSLDTVTKLEAYLEARHPNK